MGTYVHMPAEVGHVQRLRPRSYIVCFCRMVHPAGAEAALVQFPTSRLKNRYMLVSDNTLQNTDVSGCV